MGNTATGSRRARSGSDGNSSSPEREPPLSSSSPATDQTATITPTAPVNAMVDTWIGLDVGTTNSSVAVWDSGSSQAQWMKLGTAAGGSRLVPSTILLATQVVADGQLESELSSQRRHKKNMEYCYQDVTDLLLGHDDDNGDDTQASLVDDDDDESTRIVAYVGAPAQYLGQRLLQQQQPEVSAVRKEKEAAAAAAAAHKFSMDQVSAATLTSLKRLWGQQQDTRSELETATTTNEVLASFSSSPLDLVVPERCQGNNDAGADNDRHVLVRVHPLGCAGPILVSPVCLVAILMRALRLEANDSLRQRCRRRNTRTKQRWIPPGGRVEQQFRGSQNRDDKDSAQHSSEFNCAHCVLGVPAGWGPSARQEWIQAARLAGFSFVRDDKGASAASPASAMRGISTIIESTAATMSYGLLVSQQSSRTVLVLDMGGGTSDVTIAQTTTGGGRQQDDSKTEIKEQLADMKVLVTEGDAQLGGDDMDAALLQFVLGKAAGDQRQNGIERIDNELDPTALSRGERRALLQQCQRAKEQLCGDKDQDQPAKESVEILVGKNCRVTVTQNDLEVCLEDCLARLRRLVETVVNRYYDETRDIHRTEGETESPSTTETLSDQQRRDCMDEVVLIGGATRVPAVRRLLTKLFPPPPDLCTAVHPMAAVSQGAAIQAAVESQLVPLHELRSALMLDTVPHAMGVLVPSPTSSEDGNQGRFVEILARDAPLPARGSAQFELAHVDQPGVTVAAVEHVRDWQCPYQPLGEFSFLLHRLTAEQKKLHPELREGHRKVEIGMTLTVNGEFVVSVLDENDPEQMRKLPRHGKSNQAAGTTTTNKLTYTSAEEEVTTELALLLVACFVLFLLYIAAKILFRDELVATAEHAI